MSELTDPEEASISYAPALARREPDRLSQQIDGGTKGSSISSLEIKVDSDELSEKGPAGRRSAQLSDGYQRSSWPSDWPTFLFAQYSMSVRFDGSVLQHKLRDSRRLQHRRKDVLGSFPVLAILRTKLITVGLLIFAVYLSYRALAALSIILGAQRRQAAVFKFTVQESGLGSMPTLANVGNDFFVSKASCPLPAVRMVRSESSITVWHAKPVHFDGWSYNLVGNDTRADPVSWRVEVSSTDESSFERLAMHRSLSWDWEVKSPADRSSRVELHMFPSLMLIGLVLAYGVLAFGFLGVCVFLLMQHISATRGVMTIATAVGVFVNLIVGVILAAQLPLRMCGHHFRNAAILGLLFPCLISARLEKHTPLSLVLGGFVGLGSILWQAQAEWELLDRGVRLLTHAGLMLLGLILVVRRRQELAGFRRRVREDVSSMDAAWEVVRQQMEERPQHLGAFRAALATLAATCPASHPIQLAVGLDRSPPVTRVPSASPGMPPVRATPTGGEPSASPLLCSVPTQTRSASSSPRSGSPSSSLHHRLSFSLRRRGTASAPDAARSDRLVPVSSLDQLYSQADGCVHLLREKVGDWASAAAGWLPVSPQRANRGDEEREYALYNTLVDRRAVDEIHWTPVKPEDQALDKVLYRYGGRVEKLLDACRESIVFETLERLTDCLMAISTDPDVKLERVVNTMTLDTSAAAWNGFRAVVLNLRITNDDARFLGVEGHVCELILLLRPIADRISLASHHDYSLTRSMRTMNKQPFVWSEHSDAVAAFFRRVLGFHGSGHRSNGAARIFSQRATDGLGRVPAPQSESVFAAASSNGEGGHHQYHQPYVAPLLLKADNRFKESRRWSQRWGRGEWSRGRDGSTNGRSKRNPDRADQRAEQGLVSTFSEVVYQQWQQRVRGLAWSLDDPQRMKETTRRTRATSVLSSSYPITVAMSKPWFPLAFMLISVFALTMRFLGVAQVQVQPSMARLARFSALKLRNGTTLAEVGADEAFSLDRPVVSELGVWAESCEMPLVNGTISSRGLVQTFAFAEPRNLSGFFFRTPLGGLAELDPVMFMMETSMDGEEWTVLGTSRRFVAYDFSVSWLNMTYPTPMERGAKVDVRRGVPSWFMWLWGIEVVITNGGFFALGVFSAMGRYSWGKSTLTGTMAAVTITNFVQVAMELVNRTFVVFPSSLMSAFMSAMLTAMFLWKERMVMESFIVAGLGGSFIVFVNHVFFYPDNTASSGVNASYLVTPLVLLAFGSVFLVRRHLAWRASVQKIQGDIEQYEAVWQALWADSRQRSALLGLQKMLVASHGHHHLLHVRQKYRPLQTSSLHQSSPQLVHSLDLLYVQAAGLAPMLQAKVKQWATVTNGRFPSRAQSATGTSSSESGQLEYPLWAEVEGTEAEQRVEWTALKPPERAVEKLIRSYNGRAWMLLDVGRQCIVFEHGWELSNCVATILDDTEVRVVRCKNRFRADYDCKRSAGYRDVNLGIQITTSATKDLGLDRHVVELQLSLLDMAKVKSDNAHRRYVKFRDVRPE